MTVTPTASIFRAPYLLTSIGSWSLVFLSAFEAMAVTTVMPVITAELDGRSLYSLAFAGTLAASVISLVVTGAWADRRGPVTPLFTSIGVFAAGLVLAGTASDMTVFVAGRLLQGLGAGALTVAIYVLIAKTFPAALHIKIFGAFASAWVLPSLVGPFVAGAVADLLSWHWVFLGVVALVAVAAALILPAVRNHRPEPTVVRHDAAESVAGRVAAAVVVAVAVVVLSYGPEFGTRTARLVAPLAVVVIAVAVRRLLPAGTFRARPGLPATVLLCAAAGAVFFGTEVYLPLLLQERYGLAPWLSGVSLTAAAVSWALASAVQGKVGERVATDLALRAGGLFLAAGTGGVLAAAVAGLHPAVVTGGWALAGLGMGTLYPRISTLVLARSEPGREGFNSSAKSIADAVGASVSLALTGQVFALAGGDPATRTPYAGVLVLTTVVAVGVVLLTGRAGQASDTATFSR